MVQNSRAAQQNARQTLERPAGVRCANFTRLCSSRANFPRVSCAFFNDFCAEKMTKKSFKSARPRSKTHAKRSTNRPACPAQEFGGTLFFGKKSKSRSRVSRAFRARFCADFFESSKNCSVKRREILVQISRAAQQNARQTLERPAGIVGKKRFLF